MRSCDTENDSLGNVGAIALQAEFHAGGLALFAIDQSKSIIDPADKLVCPFNRWMGNEQIGRRVRVVRSVGTDFTAPTVQGHKFERSVCLWLEFKIVDDSRGNMRSGESDIVPVFVGFEVAQRCTELAAGGND